MCATKSKPIHTLEVDLEYFSPDDEALLAQGAYAKLKTAAAVVAFKKHRQVALQDFLNYYYIYRKDQAHGTYASRMASVAQAATHLRGAISLNGTLNTLPGCSGEQQRIGEAMSLAIANSLFNVTAADWSVIPESTKHSTFDFERPFAAITPGNSIVQIEAKGTFLTGAARDAKNIANHAANIAQKKQKIDAAGSTYKHPAAARYGMIVAAHPKKTLKCFLLDPPEDRITGEPSNLKIAYRLEYVADVLFLIAPRAGLIKALRDRAKLWREGSDPARRGPLPTESHGTFASAGYVENALAQRKVWIEDLEVVGQLFSAEPGHYFFVGLHADVLRYVIDHNPAQMAGMNWPAESREVIFEAEPVLLGSDSRGGAMNFDMVLHKATSGVVIGQMKHDYLIATTGPRPERTDPLVDQRR